MAGTEPAPVRSALTSGTSVVTLGIGGNDIGFSGIIEDCASLSPFGSPCRNRYVVNGVDQLAVRIQQTAQRRSPPSSRASTSGRRAPTCSWWATRRSARPRLRVLAQHAHRLTCPTCASTHKSLNAMLAQQAQANGAIYVDVYTPISRDVCTGSGTRWVEPILPANPAAPVHPNARGMDGMAARRGRRHHRHGLSRQPGATTVTPARPALHPSP